MDLLFNFPYFDLLSVKLAVGPTVQAHLNFDFQLDYKLNRV